MPGDYNYYDQGDPNLGSQTDAGQRASGNQDVWQSVARQVQSLPAYQQWLQVRGGNLSDADRKQAAYLLRSYGVNIPDGMDVNANGQVAPIDHTTRNRLLTAAMAAPLFLPSGAAGAGGGYVASDIAGTQAAAYGGGAAASGAAGGGYIANAVADTARKARGAASTADTWIERLAPLIGLGTQAATGGFSTPQVGIDPTLQQHINDLIGVQTKRAQQSQPLYEAAMLLAGQLAPTSNTSPRVQSAVQAAGMPVSGAQRGFDPAVTDALRRMGGL